LKITGIQVTMFNIGLHFLA